MKLRYYCVSLLVVFILYFGYMVESVRACCNNSQCSGGSIVQTCVNVPSGCGADLAAGEGVCVSNIETCNSDNDCSGSEVCVNSLCRAVGSVPCGEFYACPTANNPGKQCQNTCGGGESFELDKTFQHLNFKTFKHFYSRQYSPPPPSRFINLYPTNSRRRDAVSA